MTTTTNSITTNSTTTEPTAFDPRTMFNGTVYRILNGEVENKCFIEFIELCIFYQKMNERNTNVLKQLSDAVCAKYDYVEQVNNALNSLGWDEEDECLYRFMTSFTNL
jgi:hypothetical protein